MAMLSSKDLMKRAGFSRATLNNYLANAMQCAHEMRETMHETSRV